MQAQTRTNEPEEVPVAGDAYDRYHARNPLARRLMHGYLDEVARLVGPLEVTSVLDVGCGEGHFLGHIRSLAPRARCIGVDRSERVIESARSAYPDMEFEVQSAYGLGFADSSFDLVVAADLLQHSNDPQRILRELARVSRRYVLLTVPREPLWRMLNVARLAYLDEWGNPPGHVQHYRRGDFLNMVRGHFRIAKVLTPLPWIVVLARKGAP
jgi:ubiquinone/menaquinone biosynthesis C-methylase UbiE